jgi:predicted nucleic acid-binding protein
VAFTANYNDQLLTTTWVLTEVADGLATPANRSLFVDLFTTSQSDPQVTLILPESELFHRGIALYASRPDKSWSLTDCISFCAMWRHGITEALTGDHHFEQAGFRALLM